jgi:hypothetical protein
MSEITKYLPWDWTIKSLDPSFAPCPPSSTILGTYAVVNVVTAVVSILLGHRKVTKFLTCHACGKEGSRAYYFTWIFPCGLQLAANALNAWIMKNSPHYAGTFSVSEIMLFYTARPRLSFIFLCYLVRWTSDDDDDPAKDVSSPYISAFMSSFIAELVLQIIALYIMGRTVHFAASQGYYVVTSSAYQTIPHGAHLMYGGALFYLIGGGVLLLGCFDLLKSHSGSLDWVLASLPYTWLASWLFWAGFVKLAGPLYVSCAPTGTKITTDV